MIGELSFMREYYTISEISKIFDISVDTLRYYSKIDLISPKYVGENKYRYYSIEQVESISTILFLKSIGTPLDKIKDLLHDNDISKLQNELLKQEKILQDKINHLQQLKLTVESFHTISQGFNDSDISVKYISKLWMITQPFRTKEVELYANDIAKAHEDVNSSWILTSNIISTLDISCLLNRNYHTYSRYGLISEFPCDTKSPYLSVLNEGYYVCANTKIYEPNHSDVDIVYDKMLSFIEDNNLIITGEAIERNVLDMYTNENNDTVHFMRIYIPIKRKDDVKHDKDFD